MSYFEENKEIEEFLSLNNTLSDLSILSSLLRWHLRRSIKRRNHGLSYDKKNMLLTNYPSYVSILNPMYLFRKLLYFFLPATFKRKKRAKKKVVLLSPYMCSRFPEVVDRLSKEGPILFLVTALNFRFARLRESSEKIKAYSKFYNWSQNRHLNKVLRIIEKDFVAGAKKMRKIDTHLLLKLEDCLKRSTEKISTVLEEENVSQFISSYGNRFDDILISFACKNVGIPSKELAHGVNCYTLQNGAAIYPDSFDYALVWSEQMKDNISLYGGDSGRIKVVGYPRIVEADAKKYQEMYPEKKQITYFSSAIYNIFDRSSPLVSDKDIEAERIFRLRVFDILSNFAKNNKYDVQIRYHNGEKVKGARDFELKYLEENTIIKVSRSTYIEDLFHSEICLGVNTSCLYEAMVVGKKSLQVEFEFNKNTYFNEVERVCLSNLNERLEILKTSSKYSLSRVNSNDEKLLFL